MVPSLHRCTGQALATCSGRGCRTRSSYISAVPACARILRLLAEVITEQSDLIVSRSNLIPAPGLAAATLVRSGMAGIEQRTFQALAVHPNAS